MDKWGKYWGTGKDETDELTWEAALMPHKLTPNELIRVAKTFPEHPSARGGWHPGVLSKVSDGALAALADLCMVIEHLEDCPPSLRQVLVKLIPTPGGRDTRM